MTVLHVGPHPVGAGCPCLVVAEIGINHNGEVAVAKQLVNIAKLAGCSAVKFQKRTVEVVYTPEELAKPRENPFGPTNGDLKRGLEFSREAYQEIDAYCASIDMPWFASCWDEAAVDFIEAFHPPCYKVASASLTDDGLLRHTRKVAGARPIMVSTGMSTLEQIDHAVEVLGKANLILLHTNSTYPSDYKDLNLRVMATLRERYGVPVGYSGHETGIASSIAAVAVGATVLERHITLDRAMWGSDQAASLAPTGIMKLVRDLRLVELSMGSPEKRLLPTEVPIMQKLRRKGL